MRQQIFNAASKSADAIVLSRRSIAALLVSLPWFVKSAMSDELLAPQTPVAFDIGQRNNAAIIDVKIPKARSYVIELRFSYKSVEERHRVEQLVGRPGSTKIPGVPVGIAIKLFRLVGNTRTPQLLLDKQVITQAEYAYAVDFFDREIVTVNLDPGVYRVEARTIDDNPAFAGTQVSLVVDYYAKLQFVPRALTLPQ
jgi:hypothetical protein